MGFGRFINSFNSFNASFRPLSVLSVKTVKSRLFPEMSLNPVYDSFIKHTGGEPGIQPVL